MKKPTYAFIGALVFATIVAFSTARAQSINQELIANIPFEFNAGNKTLPAGEYSVRISNPASDLKILRIRSTNGDVVVLQMHSVLGRAQNSGKFVFHRYGNRYFLAQAWMPADEIGMEAPRVRIAGGAVSSVRKIETVALAARKN